VESTSDTHWLYTWIDECKIRSEHQVEALFQSGHAVQRLHELALQDTQKPVGIYNDERPDIIAGYNMDLSATMSCVHHDCLARELDRLFSKVWHYFDRIVVEGPSASRYVRNIENTPRDKRPKMTWEVREAVATLLYLREIGADRYLVFREKPRAFCQDHLQRHARELGLTALANESIDSEIIDAILQDADISLKKYSRPTEWYYTYRHPSLDEAISGSIVQKNRPKPPDVAQVLYRRAGLGLIGDVALAQWMNLPLALAAGPPAVRLDQTVASRQVDEKLVALELALPVISGVTASDLLRFREDHWPHFERFRATLRTAIREQIERVGSTAPEAIAHAVRTEFIEPELADIERRLRLANKSLSAKSGAVFAVGTIVTSVGLIISAPIVVAAGVAASGAVVPSILKYVEDKTSLETSDLYFLWRASRRGSS
jgi:hypothetical protein